MIALRVGIMAAAAGALLACAGSATRSTQATSNVITAEEIAGTQSITAYDAVQRLRPHTLERRDRAGAISLTNPAANTIVVYVDGVRMGDVDHLRAIRAGDVARMEILSASQATTRYGTGHSGGAIVVQLQR